MDDQEAEWWEAWRKNVLSDTMHKRVGPRADNRSRKRRKLVKEEVPEQSDISSLPGAEVPMSVDDFDEDESLLQEDMRILIKVGSLSRFLLFRTASDFVLVGHYRRFCETRGPD